MRKCRNEKISTKIKNANIGIACLRLFVYLCDSQWFLEGRCAVLCAG
jgi:hypothetical protein